MTSWLEQSQMKQHFRSVEKPKRLCRRQELLYGNGQPTHIAWSIHSGAWGTIVRQRTGCLPRDKREGTWNYVESAHIHFHVFFEGPALVYERKIWYEAVCSSRCIKDIRPDAICCAIHHYYKDFLPEVMHAWNWLGWASTSGSARIAWMGAPTTTLAEHFHTTLS